MTTYRFLKAADDNDFTTFYASHSAAEGTWVVRVFDDGEYGKFPVLFWGLLADGSPVPITMDGPWDGATDTNRAFVQLPSGRCVQFEADWDNLNRAVQAIRDRPS